MTLVAPPVRILAAGALLLGAACGGHGPTAPASPPQTPAPGVLTGPESLSGRVVENQTGVPIPGAEMTFTRFDAGAESTATTRTDAAGRFAIGNLPDTVVTVTLSAPGYVDRQTQMRISTSHTGVVVDMIRNAAPFSLDFYREFARNGYETPKTLEPLRPWTVDPIFYIRTVTGDSVEPVAPPVIAAVEAMIAHSVPELSGGRRHAAGFETGTDARESQSGWVRVTFYASEDAPELGAAGRATVGGNGGTMALFYDAASDAQQGEQWGGCSSFALWSADHEIVHTMGFYHTSGDGSEFHSLGCSGSNRPAVTQYHAAVVYTRPPLNVDPDRDITPFYLLDTAGLYAAPNVVTCPLSRIR